MTIETISAIQQLTPIFQTVANKLGEGANYFWPIMVKNVYITGIWEGVAGIVLILVAIGCWVTLFSSLDGKDKIPFIFVGFIFFLISLAAFFNASVDLINPQHGAFQEIVQIVKV